MLCLILGARLIQTIDLYTAIYGMCYNLHPLSLLTVVRCGAFQLEEVEGARLILQVGCTSFHQATADNYLLQFCHLEIDALIRSTSY